MKPESITALIAVALMLAYGLSRLHANRHRLLSLVDMFSPVLPPPSRSVQRVTSQPYTRRTSADRQAEAQLIRAALAAGLDPAWLAKALKGNPIYNRRRITTVARQAEQAVTG